MSDVNVDFVTKVIEVDVNDHEPDALAAQAAINSAARAEEAANEAKDAALQTVAAAESELNGYVTAAETASANAAESFSQANTVAAALTEFLETKETLTAPAVDATLSISGAAADAQVAGVLVNSKSINLEFEQGNIDNYGNDLASTTTIRTGYMCCPMGFVFTVPNGYKAYIRYYSSDTKSSINGNSGSWLTGAVNIFSVSTKYIRIMLRNSAESTITPADISTPIVITLKGQTDKTLTQDNVPADAKITGEIKHDLYASGNFQNPDMIFEQGNIDASGNDVSSTTRLRTGYLYCPTGFSFTVPNGYQAYIRYYSDIIFNKINGNSGSWLTGTVNITGLVNVNFIRVLLAKLDDSTITPSDISTPITIELKGTVSGVVIYGGEGTNFPTFRAATEYLANFRNAVLIMEPGSYDLGIEYATEIAADDNTTVYGPCVGNNNTIVFCAGAKVFCNNTDEEPHLKFSLLHICGDAKIVNADFECTNIRYCVHDDILHYYLDFDLSSVTVHTVIYESCKMKHNGFYGQPETGTPACIGIGCGLNEKIIVDGGDYSTAEGQGYYGTNWKYAIFMHNKQNKQFGDIEVKNAVFNDSTFAITDMSESNCSINVRLSGNSFGVAPWFNENGDSTAQVTKKLWNNTIS